VCQFHLGGSEAVSGPRSFEEVQRIEVVVCLGVCIEKCEEKLAAIGVCECLEDSIYEYLWLEGSRTSRRSFSLPRRIRFETAWREIPSSSPSSSRLVSLGVSK